MKSLRGDGVVSRRFEASVWRPTRQTSREVLNLVYINHQKRSGSACRFPQQALLVRPSADPTTPPRINSTVNKACRRRARAAKDTYAPLGESNGATLPINRETQAARRCPDCARGPRSREVPRIEMMIVNTDVVDDGCGASDPSGRCN